MKVKELFISRFEHGKLIEVDFKQIEVVVAAHLANDKVLKQEVIDGVDLHTANAKWVFNKDTVTKEERQIAKDVTFGVLYGAGKYKLSQTVKVDPDTAQEFIDKFYTKYYGIADWHRKLIQEAGKNKLPFDTYNGRTLGKCEAVMNYGKQYVYYERYNEKYDRISFNPPDIKNYPVQGMAGDILRVVLGDLFRVLLDYKEQVILINTVHDSIMFDCITCDINDCIVWLENYFKKCSLLIKNKLDSTWELPLRVDIKVGDSWGNLKEV